MNRKLIATRPISAREKQFQEIAQRMAEYVPQLVKKLKLRKQVFAIGLNYHMYSVPPLVGIGLESDRQKWREKYSAKVLASVEYNPAEYRPYYEGPLEIKDEFINKRCRNFFDSYDDEPLLSKKELRQLNVMIAIEMNKVDWSKILNITDDFIVYATDFENVDLRKNLAEIRASMKSSAPPKRGRSTSTLNRAKRVKRS